MFNSLGFNKLKVCNLSKKENQSDREIFLNEILKQKQTNFNQSSIKNQEKNLVNKITMPFQEEKEVNFYVKKNKDEKEDNSFKKINEIKIKPLNFVRDKYVLNLNFSVRIS